MRIELTTKYGLEIWIVKYKDMYLTEFLSEFKAVEYMNKIETLLKGANR